MEIERIEKMLGAKLREVEQAKTLADLYLEASEYTEYAMFGEPVLKEGFNSLFEEAKDRLKGLGSLWEEYEKFRAGLPKPTSKKERAQQAHATLVKMGPHFTASRQFDQDVERKAFGSAYRLIEILQYVNPTHRAYCMKSIKQSKDPKKLEEFNRKFEVIDNILLSGFSDDIERDQHDYGRWFGTDPEEIRRDVRKVHNYLLNHLREIAEVGETTTIGKISFRAKDGWFRVGNGKPGTLKKGSKSYKIIEAIMSEPNQTVYEAFEKIYGESRKIGRKQQERAVQSDLSLLRKALKIEGVVHTERSYIKIEGAP